MFKARLSVQGSAKTPYDVTFYLDETQQIVATCSCPAGQNGTHCKHRIRILNGDVSDVIDGDLSVLSQIISHYQKSDLQKLIEEMNVLDEEIDALKNRKKALTKQIGQALLGH